MRLPKTKCVWPMKINVICTVDKWFENYLVDRSQYVNIDGNVFLSRKLDCGVPQGSILGPLLYLLM